MTGALSTFAHSLPAPLRTREAAIAFVLAATVIAVSLFNPAFRSAHNLADMLTACAPTIIVGCAVALVVITGEIDISVGSLFGFCAVLMGALASPTRANLPPSAVVPIVLTAGLAVGLINGLLVTRGKVPSIIVTLGTLTALRGINDLILGGQWITDLPPSLRAFATSNLLGLTPDVWAALACVALGIYFTRHTIPGLRTYAVGSSSHAATLAGVSVNATKLTAFALAGLLTAVAAIFSVPQLPVIESGIGVGFELLVITAVVVGGVSVRGGVGTLVGVLLAAILLGIVRTVLIFLKLGPAAAYWERSVHGIFILAAVVLDCLSRPMPTWSGASSHASTATRLPPWMLALLALAATLALAAFSRPEFLALDTQLSLLPQAAEVALLAVPMTLIMLTGGIDLSVGSIMALSAVAFGLSFERGASPLTASFAALLTGALCGSINALFITRARIHPLVVTLATMSLFRGLAEGVSSARPISGFGESITSLGTGRMLGLPAILLPVIATYAIAGVVLWRAVAGRNIRAVGFNETACRFSGIAVDRLKLTLYTLSGAAAGLAAILLIARRNTAKADAGLGIELDVITAVVLGGTSVNGGRGSLFGTLLGVLALHEIRQFIAWRWASDEWVQIVVGAVLIGGVLATRTLMSKQRSHS